MRHLASSPLASAPQGLCEWRRSRARRWCPCCAWVRSAPCATSSTCQPSRCARRSGWHPENSWDNSKVATAPAMHPARCPAGTHSKHYPQRLVALWALGACRRPVLCAVRDLSLTEEVRGIAGKQMSVACVPEQAWTYKILGFPVPYLVVGRWGLTPFPRRTPLRFVVGAPIDPPEVPLGGEVRAEPPQGFRSSVSAAVRVCGFHPSCALLRRGLLPQRLRLMSAGLLPLCCTAPSSCTLPCSLALGGMPGGVVRVLHAAQ